MIPTESLAAELRDLSAAHKEDLARLLFDGAKRQRRHIPVDEARALLATIALSSAWERSQVRILGSLQAATTCLLAQGMHEEQFVDELVAVGCEHFPEPKTVELAIAVSLARSKGVRS